MSNYPPGAAYDSNAPYNEPLAKYANIVVEATADISAIVEIEVEVNRLAPGDQALLFDCLYNKGYLLKHINLFIKE